MCVSLNNSIDWAYIGHKKKYIIILEYFKLHIEWRCDEINDSTFFAAAETQQKKLDLIYAAH